MNKKFSTLMALALVAGSASAQWSETNWQHTSASAPQAAYRTFGTKSANWKNALTSVVEDETLYNNAVFKKTVGEVDGNLWYQLEVNNDETQYADVLIQERDYETGKVYLRVVAKEKAPLNASLWKLTYGKEDEATGGHWTLINKETNLELTFDHTTVANDSITEMRDGTKVWAWYDFNRTDEKKYKKLYASIHDQRYNEVMYLAYETPDTDKSEYSTALRLRERLKEYGFGFKSGIDNTDLLKGKMVKAKVVRMSNNDIDGVADALEIKPVVAYPFHMTAEQFNTRMDADDKGNSESFSFKMFRNIKGAENFLGYLDDKAAEDELVFTAEEDAASLANGNLNSINRADKNGTKFTSETYGGRNMVSDSLFNLSFKVVGCKDEKHKGTYLMADTAIYYKKSSNASPAVKFNLKNWKANDNVYMKARYYFRATYFPTNDSIVLEPLNAGIQAPFEEGTPWKDSKCTQSFVTMHYSKANTLVNDYVNPKTGSRTVSLAIDEVSGDDVLTVLYDNTTTEFFHLTINRPFEYLKRTTVPDGLYYIDLANADANERNRHYGMSIVHNMNSKLMYDTQAKNQDYSLMPATMWVVKQLGCPLEGANNYVQIQNREYPGVVFEGQLYETTGKDVKGEEIKAYRFINRRGAYSDDWEDNIGWFKNGKSLRVVDIMAIREVPEEIAYTETHGYKWFDKDVLNDGVENNFQIYWNNGYGNAILKHVDGKNIAVVNGDATTFEIAEATLPTDKGVINNDFGAALNEIVDYNADGTYKTEETINDLKRKGYLIKVKDQNLIDNDELYLASVRDEDGRYYYKAMKLSEMDNYYKKLGVFYLKADQVYMEGENVTDTCYVLVDINAPKALNADEKKDWDNYDLRKDNGWMKAAVEAGSEMRVIRDNNLEDQPNDVSDAFYFAGNPVNQYIDMANAPYNMLLNGNVKIFNKLAQKNYLFEDCNDANNVQAIQSIDPEFHYLGVESKGLDVADKAAFYVDEVELDKTNMQRYLFGVRVDSIPDGYICSHSTRVHGYWNSEAEAEDDGLVHFESYNGYTAGWFLVNLQDSVKGSTNMMHNADLYKFNSYTRLGFVEGIHQVDTIINAKGEKEPEEYLYVVKAGYSLKDLMTIDNHGSVKAKYVAPEFVLDPTKLTETDAQGNLKYVECHKISGNVNTNHTFSLRRTNSDNTGVAEDSEAFLLESKCDAIGAFKGAWVKTENGVPVIAQVETPAGNHEWNESTIAERIGQSGVFYFETTKDEATANEDIEVSSVTVIAGNGSVQIVGAAGKKVVITNILGQTVANTVITSDNATIAAPQGVVVVAVEGEDAVKAIVK